MRYAAIALISSLTVLVAACQRTNPDLTPGEFLDDTGAATSTTPVASGLPMATQQRFPDIPLPANLREDFDRTYVYQAPGLEVGRMVYTSRESVRDIAQFFIRECPGSGWTLRSSTQAENSVNLTFSKPGKALEISVRGTGVGRPQELVLHLIPATGAGMQP